MCSKGDSDHLSKLRKGRIESRLRRLLLHHLSPVDHNKLYYSFSIILGAQIAHSGRTSCGGTRSLNYIVYQPAVAEACRNDSSVLLQALHDARRAPAF
jgi:hypothetical protein